ncbi:MAG TPA: hypothetical protein VLA93_21850 [Pyrinomonadaceae bacterium]|nr:hypothetical protein [Pyrinomonadaceae bacterium]
MKRLIISLLTSVAFLLLLTTAIGQTTPEGTREEKLKPSQLPEAVAASIQANCAGCSIAKSTREKENGVTIYDIEFKGGQGEIAIAADGSVIDRETVVSLSDVPVAALDVIRKSASGGKIKQVAKGEVRAELRNGQIIKLASPRYFFEAELEKGNQVGEIEVTPEGQITEGPEWRKKGSKEN